MTPETPRIWLTLRCSMRCWFCSTRVHDFVGNWPEADELDAVQWHARIAALPGRDVVLTGGEPSLHRDFLAIVGGSPKPMYVYSNFARSDVLDQLPPGLPIHWRASFHGTTANDLGAWVDRVTAMHDKGYKVTATTVYPPEGLVKALEEHGIVIDPPQSPLPPLAGRVACTLPRVLIAPNGERYHCVTRLARRDPAAIVRHDRPGDTATCDAATGCLACDFTASRGHEGATKHPSRRGSTRLGASSATRLTRRPASATTCASSLKASTSTSRWRSAPSAGCPRWCSRTSPRS